MLDIVEVRQLSRIQPGRAQLRAVVEYALVAGLITMQVRWLPIWFYPLTTLLIASRQHALTVLMHEASHFRLAQSHAWNDFVGECVSWPLFVSMRGFRRHHHRHHTPALNTLVDADFERKMRRAPQDWTFPMPKRRLAKLLLRDVLLLNLHEYAQEARDAKNLEPGDRLYAWARLGFTLTLFAALTWLGAWKIFLLYWLLPALTWLKAILRIRSMADHFAVRQAPEVVSQTRTIVAPWWERLVLAPASIGVHGPHHLFASIPYYRLVAAHRALMRVPEYAAKAVESPSYWHTLSKELSV